MTNDVAIRKQLKGYLCSADTAGKLVIVRKPLRKQVGPEVYLDTGESLELLNPDPAPFHPMRLEGLLEGWIADDLVGANNTAVPGWAGLVATPLIQATSGAQPKLYTTDATHTINGRQVVYFNGVDAYMVAPKANPYGVQMHSVIAVCRPAPITLTEGALWSSSDESGSTSIWIWGGYDGAASNAQVFHQRNDDTEDILTGPVCANAVQIIEWKSDASKHTLRVNHADQALTVTAGANNGDSFADTVGRDHFALGARVRNTPSRFFKGDVAAVFVLSHITMAERGLLFSWIAANYAKGL